MKTQRMVRSGICKIRLFCKKSVGWGSGEKKEGGGGGGAEGVREGRRKTDWSKGVYNGDTHSGMIIIKD